MPLSKVGQLEDKEQLKHSVGPMKMMLALINSLLSEFLKIWFLQ